MFENDHSHDERPSSSLHPTLDTSRALQEAVQRLISESKSKVDDATKQRMAEFNLATFTNSLQDTLVSAEIGLDLNRVSTQANGAYTELSTLYHEVHNEINDKGRWVATEYSLLALY